MHSIRDRVWYRSSPASLTANQYGLLAHPVAVSRDRRVLDGGPSPLNGSLPGPSFGWQVPGGEFGDSDVKLRPRAADRSLKLSTWNRSFAASLFERSCTQCQAARDGGAPRARAARPGRPTCRVQGASRLFSRCRTRPPSPNAPRSKPANGSTAGLRSPRGDSAPRTTRRSACRPRRRALLRRRRARRR